MTRIRATCPVCGEVELQPRDVTLTLRRSSHELVGDGTSYRFNCPGCLDVVTKAADARIVQLLSTGGVAIEETGVWEGLLALLEPPHPERRPDGGPFTADDLLAIHELLDRDDWFDRLETALD